MTTRGHDTTSLLVLVIVRRRLEGGWGARGESDYVARNSGNGDAGEERVRDDAWSGNRRRNGWELVDAGRADDAATAGCGAVRSEVERMLMQQRFRREQRGDRDDQQCQSSYHSA